jgi:hypothetical protein
MVDIEVRDVYSLLRQYLIDNDFGWIVDQVDEEIKRGKSLTKSTKDIGLSNMYLAVTENKKALGKEVVVAESYTLPEQLKILIKGIEIGIIDPYRMTSNIFELVNGDVDGNGAIIFASDDGIDEKVVNRSQLHLLNNKSEELLVLLNELKRNLRDAN